MSTRTGKLSAYGFGKAPLNMTQKAPTIIKEKMYLLHFIKMKNICSSKDTKTGSSQTEKTSADIWTGDLSEVLHSENKNPVLARHTNLPEFLNDLNRLFTKQDGERRVYTWNDTRQLWSLARSTGSTLSARGRTFPTTGRS